MLRRDGAGSFSLRRLGRVLLAVSTLTAITVAMPVSASPSEFYGGPHFGDGNIPAGCEEDLDPASPRWWSPDQDDLDGDGVGDACDPDTDGDGHADGKERAHGTDPHDPESYPTKDGKG